MDIMLNRIIELIGSKRGASKEFANAIGIPANLITDWKAGRNKSYPKYAPQIAEHYGVSLDWLFGLTDEREKPATDIGSRLSEKEIKFLSIINQLPPDKLELVEELAKMLLSTQ